MKEEKDIAPMDFAEYLGLLKWKVLLHISKSRWDVQYLEYLDSHINGLLKQVLSNWLHF